MIVLLAGTFQLKWKPSILKWVECLQAIKFSEYEMFPMQAITIESELRALLSECEGKSLFYWCWMVSRKLFLSFSQNVTMKILWDILLMSYLDPPIKLHTSRFLGFSCENCACSCLCRRSEPRLPLLMLLSRLRSPYTTLITFMWIFAPMMQDTPAACPRPWPLERAELADRLQWSTTEIRKGMRD